MKIGIISDIHNNLENLKKAVAIFNANRFDLIICCGDWTLPSALKGLCGLNAPVKSVLGNCDTEKRVYEHHLEYDFKDLHLNVEISSDYLELNLDGKKIAATHGDDQILLDKIINYGRYDLVCIGHTHRPSVHKKGNTVIVNPGSLAGVGGLKREPIIPSIAVYDTKKGVAEIEKLD